MAKVNYIEANGTAHVISADHQESVMEGAVINSLPGMEGMCGGMLSCGTCHCYIDEQWLNRLEPPTAEELAMLESMDDRRPNSRLGCQIRITDDLSGLVVHLPVEP
jgi:2Fe-2S ferredoxin